MTMYRKLSELRNEIREAHNNSGGDWTLEDLIEGQVAKHRLTIKETNWLYRQFGIPRRSEKNP